MTTIAFRDGVLAFDSQVTTGNEHSGTMIKGIKTKKFIAAASGLCEDCQAFLDWLEESGSLHDKELYGIGPLQGGADISALVYNFETKKLFQFEQRVYPFQIKNKFHALGSGAHFAIGAMAMDADAKTAVEIAAKHDVYTGGTIRTLTIEE